MDNQAKKDGANQFAAAFATAFAEAMAAATGSPWPLMAMDGPDPAANKGTPLHFRLTVEGAISGDCFVEMYEPQVSSLIAKIVKEPVTELADEHVEALAKVIATATTALAASLSDKFGAVSFKVDRVAGLAFGGMLVVSLAASPDESNVQVLLYFGGQLLDELSAISDQASAHKRPDSMVSPNNLKLVMDVELNVSLRFGQRQMPLREVLELGSGSVIELDRMIDEPVELYLDGKLIARGEAVVVDGNYGLRVTEIPQPVASHLLN
ncbi:MAG TPA: flagellar motor switch protein FliN [Terracidiphilus sp.]|jgi:flagellar motor switch protein FliN/FliY|nr:flagellar motor switch protein FliN [Terracidiphilus sp.]